ncbi:uncharacterized protein LOC110462951 [Mizuhopecten yessoensis]|uniref:uncharacterized protein LOC110462951 n=1 Tax=Mizuhopecten yessoensis TaxID=6573 RepID=UPI000B45F53A|nr:uncharacterized protein LOC110462951 [Mizuhopecten yessoensis]
MIIVSKINSSSASVVEMQTRRDENQYDQINRNEREPPSTYEQINNALTAEHYEDTSPVDSAEQQRVYEVLRERSDQNVYDDLSKAQTGNNSSIIIIYLFFPKFWLDLKG